MHNCQYLFVYGSFLSDFKSQAYEYITKYFDFVGEATVTGTLYDMGSFPVAKPKDTGRIIRGELYKVRNVHEFSFVMAQLDDHEGLYPAEGEEVYYERCLVEARLPDGQKINSWIYWYLKDVSGKPMIDLENMVNYKANNH